MSTKKRDRLFGHFRRSGKPASSADPAQSSTNIATATPAVQSEENQVENQAQNLANLSLEPRHAPEPIHGASSEQSLWARAYGVVAASDPAILRPFEEIFSAPNTSFEVSSQLQSILQKSLQDRDDRALVLSIAGKKIHMRQQGEKIIKFVMWSRDWITPAIINDPHAALVWMSVSLLLPLVLRPVEQNAAMLDGLETITELLSLYKIRLERYSSRGVTRADFEDNVVQIFAKIIEYQARCIRHLNRGSLNRLAHNIGGNDNWKQSLESIQAKEQHIVALTGLLDRQEEAAALNAQLNGIDTQIGLQESIVRVLSEWREEQQRTRVSEAMQKCLHALSSAYREGKDLNKERVPNTCEWFLQGDELAKWRDTDGPSVLWISADPGCGKSVLSRCLVDEKRLSSTIIGSTTCYFFFKEGLTGRRTMADALAAILHQLFRAEPGLLTHAMDSYYEHGSEIRNRPSDLWDILLTAAKHAIAGEIVVLIDALDECEPEECGKLLRAIAGVVRNAGSARMNLKFCMTSRPYTRIEAAMMGMHQSTTYIRVPGEDKLEAIGREIDLVIVAEVPSRFPMLSHNQQEKVAQMLKSKKNRTYLWLYLVMGVIQEQIMTVITDAELENLINKLPRGVQAAYAAILSRCPAQEKARTLLQMVVAAQRPLTVQELMVALTVAGQNGPGKDSIDFDPIVNVSLPSLQTATSNLKNICGLLLSVSNERVYLLHETVREFLIDITLLNNDPTNDWQHFEIAHANATMARVCVIVLNALDVILPRDKLINSVLKQARQHDESVSEVIGEYLETYSPQLASLLTYAAEFWYFHGEDGFTISSSSVLHLGCDLLEGERTSCLWWYYQGVETKMLTEETRVPFTPLTLAALFNQAAIIEALVHQGHDVNGRTEFGLDNDDSDFGNALCAAIDPDHMSAIQTLIKLGADVNEKRGLYGTPLHLAEYDERLYSVLIEQGADINAKGSRKNVLELAAYQMSPEKVERCVRFGANDYDSARKEIEENLTILEKGGGIASTEYREELRENGRACLDLLNDADTRHS